MFKVTVPATSANLGVGYDVMGLALSLSLTVTFSPQPAGVTVTGGEPRFQNADNLIYRAFVRGCQALSQPVPGVHLDVVSEIPAARGLGSSAACIVAGLVGANQWFGEPLDRLGVLQLATAMEGHPDNVAPAIFGQLAATIMAAEKPVVAHYQVHPSWHFAVVIPDTPLSTAEARAVLPTQMSYAEASYQMGHCTLACTALERGDHDLLQAALQDKMQEPYRAKLIPDFDQVRALGASLDIPVVISGAGSTMLAISGDGHRLQRFVNQARMQHPNWQVQALAIAQHGYQVGGASCAVAE
ncbi:MAG: homoserine kinase [Lactobacillus sp.]|jgi:homoserine kinase|nr:homoserine kinase [Lactobacillus sp.]MCI2033575.1 homoserine kinase [Lactobacillus sp.]